MFKIDEWYDFPAEPPKSSFVILWRTSGEYILCDGNEVMFYRKEYPNIKKWKIITYAPDV